MNFLALLILLLNIFVKSDILPKEYAGFSSQKKENI